MVWESLEYLTYIHSPCNFIYNKIIQFKFVQNKICQTFSVSKFRHCPRNTINVIRSTKKPFKFPIPQKKDEVLPQRFYSLLRFKVSINNHILMRFFIKILKSGAIAEFTVKEIIKERVDCCLCPSRIFYFMFYWNWCRKRTFNSRLGRE